jgi:hypothetical protein
MKGARTERREILPYTGLDGYIKQVRYRHSTNSKFQELEGTPRSILVPVDDLRSVPRHEIGVLLDETALPAVYKKDMEKLCLVVLTRDSILKKEWLLYQAPIKGLPDTFVLDSAKLRETSCRAQMVIDLNICAVKMAKTSHWPKRRASRLLTWQLNLVNQSKGPRFPWIRKSSEDFRKAGLPGNSTFFLNLLAEPEDLIKETDARVDELLEVWVHEEPWIAFQQSNANPGVAALQRYFVAQVATQILEIASKPLAKGQQMTQGSVCEQLVSHMAVRAKVEPDALARILKKESASTEIAPYVFATFAINKAMTRVLDQ